MLKIFNEDCRITMKKLIEDDVKVDNIITSPFYNTGKSSSAIDHHNRYDVHMDNLSDEEYIQFTISIFNLFDKILKPNGSILYNMSYGSKNSHLLWLVIADVIKNTNFTIIEDVIWKKKSAMPNTSPNKLTRIVEHIFVFVRKSEQKTFKSNKKFKTRTKNNGQKIYENIYNFIEAKNNDGANKLNKATFSTDLILKLLNIYVPKKSLIYDPFMGTGTTLNACKIYGCDCIGSEISKAQCDYAYNRLGLNK